MNSKEISTQTYYKKNRREGQNLPTDKNFHEKNGATERIETVTKHFTRIYIQY